MSERPYSAERARPSPHSSCHAAIQPLQVGVASCVRALMVAGALFAGNASRIEAQETRATNEHAAVLPKTMEEWRALVQRPALDRLHRDILMLDADGFDTREAASASIVAIISDVARDMNPPPPEMLALFADLAERERNQELSPEQCMRMHNAEQYLSEELSDEPDRIPAMEYSVQECLRLIGQQTGFTIVAPHLDGTTGLPQIEVTHGKNDCGQVLSTVCEKTGSEVVFDDDPRILNIMPKGKEGRRRFFSYKKNYHTVTGEESETGKINIRMSPRSAMLIFIQPVGDGSVQKQTIDIGECAIKHWTVCKGTYYKLPRNIKRADDAGVVSVVFGVVSAPKTIRVACGEKSKRVGFQEIEVAASKEESNHLMITLDVGGGARWIKTPGKFDSILYGAADTNAYAAYDKNGALLPHKILDCTVMRRTMIIRMECSAPPASVEAKIFTKFSEKIISIAVP